MSRRVFAEDEDWTLESVPRLSRLCLHNLMDNLQVFVERDVFAGLSHSERHFVERKLSPFLPLPVTAGRVPDGLYWKRCCQQKWDFCDVSRHGGSWKRMFVERQLAAAIELFVPGVTEPKAVLDMIPFCRNSVRKLEVSQLLLPLRDPEQEEELHDSVLELKREEDGPPADHFDFSCILPQLLHLQELHLEYRDKQCGMNFHWGRFKMSKQDCMSLAKALKTCRSLKVLSLQRSSVGDPECQLLASSLHHHPSLEELHLSYNLIGDVGARALARLLGRSKLGVLNLTFNRIRQQGAEALALALSPDPTSPASTLRSLHLDLNPLGEDGCRVLAEALLTNHSLLQLHLGACGASWRTGVALSRVLLSNDTLQSLNLSANDLGQVGGEALEKALAENSRITECDVSRTKMDPQSVSNIYHKVHTNQEAGRDRGSKSEGAGWIRTKSDPE